MPNLFSALAEQACGAKRCEDAIHALESDLQRQPSDALACYELGLCYSGGCHSHSLVSPEMAVAYLRRALCLTNDTGLLRAYILEALGNTLAGETNSRNADALCEAIACHSQAADLYRAAGKSADRARAQFNLGNSCCELSEATGENHWREAIGHYEDALAVRTPGKDPAGRAAVLENLGTAYRQLRGSYVEKAVGCYRRALRLCSPTGSPARYAALQNNLGNALLSLPVTDETTACRNARRALRRFNCALNVLSPDPPGCSYGITQCNRGQAYRRLSRGRDRQAALAAKCLKDAYAVFVSCGEQQYAEVAKEQLNQLRGGACEHEDRHANRS